MKSSRIVVVMIVISAVIWMYYHTKRSMIEHAAESQRANAAQQANILNLTTDWSPAIAMEDWQNWKSEVVGTPAEIEIMDLKTGIIHRVGPHQYLDVTTIKQFKVRVNGDRGFQGPVYWKYSIY